MSDKTELLPCFMPDCGSTLVGTGMLPCGVATVSCGHCGVSVPSPDADASKAIERWNRRATIQPTAAEPVAGLDKRKLRELAEFWAGKYHSAFRAVREGHQVAWDELVAYVESLAGPAERAAAPADLSEYWQAGFDGKEICPTTRGNALAAYSDGIKARAAEEQATERKPLTDADRDTCRLNWLEGMTVNVRTNLRYGSRDLFWATPEDLDGESGPSPIRAQIDAHSEQHHGIGSDKNG